MIESTPAGTTGRMNFGSDFRFRLRTLTTTFTLLAFGTACPAEEDPTEEGSSSASGDETSASGEDGSTGPGATSSDPSTDEGASTGEDGTTTGEDDSTGAEPDPACACAAQTEGPVELACEAKEVCEPVEVSCSLEPLTDCELADLTVVNPEVLECHHAVLAAGTTQALLRWELPYVADPGAAGQRTMLVSLGDRRMLVWHESWGEPTYAISDVSAAELRPAEHFDGCMELPSPEEVFRCLYDAVEEVEEVCIPAYEFPIG